MSLREIKDQLESLCRDVTDELTEDTPDRIRNIRLLCIRSGGWIDKTAHLRLKACNSLWTAGLPGRDFYDVRWEINKADGWIEEALRIDAAERLKGIPKPLLVGQSDETGQWIDDNLVESSTDHMTSADLYAAYLADVGEDDALTLIAFGMRLTKEGFEKTRKKIDGTPERVWKVKRLNP